MSTDEAIEILGGLVSQAGGEGDDALDVIKDALVLYRDVLSDIADGYERHNPGWWIKKAKAALALG